MNKWKRNEAIVIYVLFAVVMVLTLMNKKNLHVDEICSYTLSNNIGSIMMNFEEGRTYTPAEQVYIQNMIVEDNSERFQYANVWKNQEKDVHPPFYYMLLHTICSLRPGQFSIWHAALINICFALLTLYIFRKLMHLFVDNTLLVDFCSVLFIFCPGILQNISFLRMYVMAMFWITLMTYLFEKSYMETFSWKRWGQIILTAIAGALTHYYCIIYLCALCMVFGLCLVIRKRWKDAAVLCGSMALSGLTSAAIFPAMIKHMFSGYRGVQAIDNLTQSTMSEQWERIKIFYGYINTQVLGKAGSAAIVFVMLLIIVVFLDRKHDDAALVFHKAEYEKWVIAGIPAVIYFVFVSKSAAYITDRYIFPVYAVVLVFFLSTMTVIFKNLINMKYVYIVLCLIGTIFIVNGFTNAEWNYLFKSSQELLDKAESFSDKNCIGIYDGQKWKEQSAFYEVRNYKSVTFLSQTNKERILQYSDLFGDGFILTVIGGNDDGIINMIRNNYPYLNSQELLGKYAYAASYYISAGEKSLNVHIHNFDRSKTIGAESMDFESNVMLVQDEQDVWLIREDEDHAVIELGSQVFDVAGAQYAEGTNIRLYTANGSEAQLWKFVGHADGSFTLLAKDERYALTGGADGNVYLSEYHEGECTQKWWVEP